MTLMRNNISGGTALWITGIHFQKIIIIYWNTLMCIKMIDNSTFR